MSLPRAPAPPAGWWATPSASSSCSWWWRSSCRSCCCARSIGNEAPKINDALGEAVQNTAPLGALRTTIEHATIIIGGLQRGRARLGG